MEVGLMVTAWHELSPKECLIEQDSSENGIAVEEALKRQEQYGFNKLAEPEKTPAFFRFISQYNDPLNYLLIGAALVALAIHPDQPGDAIFIFIVLTANAFFGFWQEGQAEQAKLESDAYFEAKKLEADAILAEMKAKAEGIREKRAAIAGSGGRTMVKLRVAEALKGKRIVLLPVGGESGFSLQKTDINQLLQTLGVEALASQ